MNNIGKFKIERMVFNNDVKKVLNKMTKRSGITVTFYDGYIVMFDKVNIHVLTLHRIVFSKYRYNLLVLHYDDYHANKNFFFIPEEKEPYTIGSLKRYIKEYFNMIYKMNLK